MKGKDQMFKKVLATSAMLAMAASAAHAQGNIVVYNNTSTPTGGYDGSSAAYTGTGTYTDLVADDITVAAGLGGQTVNAFAFSIVNFGSAAVTVSPTISFYANSTTATAPGTILAAYNFNPITQGAGSYTVYTASVAGAFVIPTSGSFWAAESFTSTTATTTQMASVGQYLFNPPTVGSSNDYFFQSTAASQGTASNPAGSLLYFGGSPVANFGWSFTATPEPSQYAAFGLGILGIGMMALKARRRNVVA
jgi:hypothetical protein